jgi:hypothetical protein
MVDLLILSFFLSFFFNEDLFIGEYKLDLIPIDDNCMSLEMPSAFKEYFLVGSRIYGGLKKKMKTMFSDLVCLCFLVLKEGDRTCLFYVARSLMKLQTHIGIIPTIKAKGTSAKVITK